LTVEKSELVILVFLTKKWVVFVNLQKIMMFCFLRLWIILWIRIQTGGSAKSPDQHELFGWQMLLKDTWSLVLRTSEGCGRISKRRFQVIGVNAALLWLLLLSMMKFLQHRLSLEVLKKSSWGKQKPYLTLLPRLEEEQIGFLFCRILNKSCNRFVRPKTKRSFDFENFQNPETGGYTKSKNHPQVWISTSVGILDPVLGGSFILLRTPGSRF
jgi:hypothetical protein